MLCTLLIGNAIAMEALPIFLDRMVGPIIAILLSVTCVLLFGEIIPQAVCSKYGVAIGVNFLEISYNIFYDIFLTMGASHEATSN